MVVFANDERTAGKDRFEAALNAGFTRLRPVCMTALAMIIGMLPMALAFGEGGEQNAPLGRAVIGGLLLATVGTLFIVPVIYSLLKKNPPLNFDQEIDAGIPRRRGSSRIMPNEFQKDNQSQNERKLADSFADPNSLDDQNLGNAFVGDELKRK